jgi:hypothetical protein
MIRLKALLLESNQLMRILDHLMNAINKEARTVGQSASFYEPTEFKDALKNVQQGVAQVKKDSSRGIDAGESLDDLMDDTITLQDMFGSYNSARGEKATGQLYHLIHKLYKQ